MAEDTLCVFEYNGFKKGDIVVSSLANPQHRTPYKIECFFLWKNYRPDGSLGENEVVLKKNGYKWNADKIEYVK